MDKRTRVAKSPLPKNQTSSPPQSATVKKPVRKKSDKLSITLFVLGAVALIAGAGCGIFGLVGVKQTDVNDNFPAVGVQNGENTKPLSSLTGLELADSMRSNAPAYCIQIPNGLDGARPQAGLTEAGVVFEAIAEAGITRFAAIFQEPTSGVIGPIRSLRTYYLNWDTPFDCTIVHAGGAADALAAVSSGGYSDLDENEEYMYRGNYGYRAWNNLFTTSSLLAEANAGRSSDITGFNRLTPKESAQERIDSGAVSKLIITEPAKGDTSTVAASVPSVNIDFGSYTDYNVNYAYDSETNTYLRSYATGDAHMVYVCTAENKNFADPEDFCTLTQVAPNVIVAIIVQESLASDNYHENITSIGSGNAYIFQNGEAIEGTWRKSSASDQLKFFKTDGTEIKLAVGQTFVEAVPAYGSVSY